MEPTGPSAPEPCCSDASPNSQSDGTAPPTSEPDTNHAQSSLDRADAAISNGSQNQTKPAAAGSSRPEDVYACGDAGPDPGPDGSSKPPAEPPQQLCGATGGGNEEDEREEARSLSPPPNELPAKRRTCRRRRRSLFTIQAVNSNGTTERGTGEGGSAVSFSCESKHTPLP